MYIYDNQEYLDEEHVPDFGSIRCTTPNSKVKSYILKEVDVDKLLKLVTYVADGSTARVVDGDQDFYTFLCGKWYKA